MKQFFLFSFCVIFLGSIAFLQLNKEDTFIFDVYEAEGKKDGGGGFTPSHQNILYRSAIPMPENTPSAHSSTITRIDTNRLLTAFFAGTKEGARDVAIYGSILDQSISNERWQKPFKIIDRATLIQDTKELIIKLGNPVLYTVNNTIHLFVVGVSIGGWATSKIYHYVASNDKKIPIFHLKKALHLSPFLNLSNLVRNRPIPIILNTHQKGFILPIYHELANKYPLNLIFNNQGDLLFISQPNFHRGLLQPSLSAIDSHHCILAFRAHKKAKNILYTQTCDNTLHYSPLISTNLKNHDNSLNLFSINHQTYLLHNTPNQNLMRGKLTLESMQSPSSFTKLFDIDSTYTPNGEVSYPSTFIDFENAMIHITYTIDRKFIGYIGFSIDYLKKKL